MVNASLHWFKYVSGMWRALSPVILDFNGHQGLGKGCRSAFILSGSQHFRLNTDPDPIRIRIQSGNRALWPQIEQKWHPIYFHQCTILAWINKNQAWRLFRSVFPLVSSKAQYSLRDNPFQWKVTYELTSSSSFIPTWPTATLRHSTYKQKVEIFIS